MPEERSAKFASGGIAATATRGGQTRLGILAGARAQLAALVFEDLHWAGPDVSRSDAVAGRARRARAPLLVVATTRPEFRRALGSAFTSQQSMLLAATRSELSVATHGGRHRSARHALYHKRLIERVSERTGGVPLFVEEVTRLLLLNAASGADRSRRPADACSSRSVARLDRLGASARGGGRSARYWDATFLPRAAARCRRALDEPGASSIADWIGLPRSTSVFVEGAPPRATDRFKHALDPDDAAYESLLKSRRQALHRRAAEALIVGRSAWSPRAIAHHFTARLALMILRSNGGARPATSRSDGPRFRKRSHISARRSRWRTRLGPLCLKAARRGERRERRKGANAAWEVAYANALIPARGYGAAETTEAFARARESAAGRKDAPEQLAADYGLWAGSYTFEANLLG